MEVQLIESLRQLRESVSPEQSNSALSLLVYLVIGGLMSLYLRFLYRRCATTASGTDSISRVFPLLTLITIGVIAVVKSSMALSLGLVGALSIVRFRSAIKEPEELVYLFLCIGVGLAMGAGRPLLAVALVMAATAFILGMTLTGRRAIEQRMVLTICGHADGCFRGKDPRVVTAVRELVPDAVLQRMDIDAVRGQLRISLKRQGTSEVTAVVAQLMERLPDCELSYVNLDATA